MKKSERTMKAFLTSVALVALASGCTQNGVVPVQNVERAASVWSKPAPSKGSRNATSQKTTHICLEYALPTRSDHTNKAKAGATVQGVPVEASYESTASMAAMYSVTEIMQFGQAALYRLCEADGNGSLKGSEYANNFLKVLESVDGLLRLQMAGQTASILTHANGLLQRADEIDREMAPFLGYQKASVRTPQRLKELRAERNQVASAYAAFAKLNRLETFGMLAELPPPRSVEGKLLAVAPLYDDLTRAENLLKIARDAFAANKEKDKTAAKDELALAEKSVKDARLAYQTKTCTEGVTDFYPIEGACPEPQALPVTPAKPPQP